MLSKLNKVISESGIWDGSRRFSHSFLLSPSVYKITQEESKQLERLGYALYECMLGLSHIATIAFDDKLNYGGAWLLARRVFSTGVPRMYHELQGVNIRHIPMLLKVDLMVDQEGNFKIAEVDGHNKHGVGYSTLGLRFRQALYSESASFPGTAKMLAGEMERLGHSELKLVYADQERFYLPEFEIAKQELEKHGVRCSVSSEMDIDGKFLRNGIFLDLPFFYQKPELYATILSAYKRREVDFIIPPKPFLGAKGVLALLRNDEGDDHLESLLRAFIKKDALELTRSYVPETFLIGKQVQRIDSARARISSKRFVLKESISSGMKGTIFSDEEGFDSMLEKAYLSNMNWILQEEVVNQSQTFSWFANSDEESSLQVADDWSMRVTVQYVNRQVGDVIVTARRDKAVHGGKDCLQLGTIIT